MASFIYYGVQNRGARKIVSSLHNTWADTRGTSIPANPTTVVAGQPWDPHKSIPAVGAPLTPEERVRVEAIHCGAHEVWKQQLPAAPSSGPYTDLLAWDWAERNTVSNMWGKVVTQEMLAGTVGVSGLLPAGSVPVYWGLNAGATTAPPTPWPG